MHNSIIESNAITRIAEGFAAQSSLSIGVYDQKGEALLSCKDFSESDVLSSITKLGQFGVETVCDLSGLGSRASAIALRTDSGELVGVVIVMASSSDSVPFDKHLSLIETVFSSYIREREQALTLSESVRDKETFGSNLSRELKQNEAITEVLGKLESEDDFDKVAAEILTLCGEFLEASDIFLLQLHQEEDAADIITEWHNPDKNSIMSRFDGVALSDIPFADGLSYTISSDSRMPDSFREFLRAHDISAGVFLPIFLEDVNVMYLCATMEIVPRHWSLTEAGFLSDVKRILSTILAKRIAKNSLASSYAVVESVLENIGCGVLVMRQEDGSVLYSNDTFHTMFSDLSDKQKFERKIRQTPDKMLQIREYNLDNSGICVSVALGVIHWVDDTLVRLATVFDITENKEYEKRIEKQANIDTLTGIYNRTYFIKELGAMLSKGGKNGAFLCMNIDGFKEVNVTLGSDGGDLLLSAIAKFLLKLSGDNARVYRLGSDEFAIVINDTLEVDPVEISKAIINRFKAPWQLAYKDCYLTASIGISLFPKDATDIASVIKTGDIALSEARKKGAGSVVFFAPSMEKELRGRILLRSFLSDAVENGCNGMSLKKESVKFVINQAEFEGCVCEFEWDAPELGMLSSRAFLPTARNRRITSAIFEKLIETAAKECRDKNDFGYPEYHYGVNIDIEDFLENDIPKAFKDAIDLDQTNPDCLVAVLRGCPIRGEEEACASKIEALRKLGVHVACAYAGDASSFESGINAVII